MGSSVSYIPKEKLDDYLKWTYLSKREIETLYKKFAMNFVGLDPRYVLEERLHVKCILEMIPQIKYNLFSDRILRVFSSKCDGCFSFEDLLDFFSVMSERCPTNVKARWAYRLFDFNEDSELTRADIYCIIYRLTTTNGESNISNIDKELILDVIMKTMDIENNDSVGPSEFEHVLQNSSDFRSAFTFTI